MALKDQIAEDRRKVFINLEEFGSTHTWNGIPFDCVEDEDVVMKRKNNNVNDISWDNNTMDVLIYVRQEDFPGRPVPNEHGYYDNRMMKILQVQTDMGMYTITLSRRSPKAVAASDDY